jgi:multisubunit Na+/H+ antiporter MnhE subunit
LIGYLEGILKIANIFLSVVAGVIAVSLFQQFKKEKTPLAWRLLIVVLVLFAVQEILGALRAFEIFTTPHLTHINPTLMLALLIWTLVIMVTSK